MSTKPGQPHQRVAECVEELFADRLEEFLGVLAHHYAEAELWEKAQAYLLKAGDQAGRVAADAEALKHYRRAIEAYGRAFGDRWDPVQRAGLECKIGEAPRSPSSATPWPRPTPMRPNGPAARHARTRSPPARGLAAPP